MSPKLCNFFVMCNIIAIEWIDPVTQTKGPSYFDTFCSRGVSDEKGKLQLQLKLLWSIAFVQLLVGTFLSSPRDDLEVSEALHLHKISAEIKRRTENYARSCYAE